MSSPSATATTLQVGTYNANTDTFTSVLDLNDKVNWYIEHKGMSIALPAMMYAESKNIRAQGINVARSQYDEMHLTISLRTQATTVAAIIANVHALFAAIEQPPYVIRIALPGASIYRYAQVVKRTYSKVPADPLELLQKMQTGFAINFTCQPGFMQPRQILHNLQANPGAEAPSGPAVPYFSDGFTNTNAYAIQAGGALSQDTTQFPDILRAQYGSTLLHYFRLDEASGTVARDAAATGNNGTISATGITYGTAGLLNGDTDTALTFTSASSGNITVPSSGLQSGTATWTYGFMFRLAAVAGALQYGVAAGTNATKQGLYMGLSTGNAFQGGVIGTNIVAGGAITTGVRHQGILSWDGTTLQLFLDGASVGTATPGALSITFGSPGAWIGSFISSASFWNGIIDEVWMSSASTNLTSVTALWNAANNAPATNATTMVIPAAGRVAFGSPAWSSYNPLTIPFRWLSGATYNFDLHYIDANNYLRCTMTGTTLSLVNNYGGSLTTMATSNTVNLVNGVQYLLSLTQFPGLPLLIVGGGVPASPQVQAVLSLNNNGVAGTAIATLGPASCSDFFGYPASFPSSLVGRPQLAASGAALAVGGMSTRLTAAGFGPGGWSFSGNVDAGSRGQASGAWEQQISACYPSGPATSYGAGRIDAAPAGTVFAKWTGGTAGSAANIQQTGIPCTAGQVFKIKAPLAGPSLPASATIFLTVTEYDATGAQLATGTAYTSGGGALTSWTIANGTWTALNTGYLLIGISWTDNTSASVGMTLWWDNIQVWNQTTTGQTTMPFCDLRGPQTPGQLTISGITGDIPAPAFLAVSTYSSGGLASNGYVQALLGRRAVPSKAGLLVHGAMAYLADSTIVPQIDSTAYGGVTIKTTNGGDTSAAFQLSAQQAASAISGSFNLLTRAQITGAATPGVVKMNATGNIPTVLVVGNVSYLTTTPFAANSAWTHVDLGAVAAAPAKPSTLANLSTTDWQASVGAQMGTTTQTGFGNYLALMPTDAEVHRWRLVNGVTAYSTPWNQVYLDGTNGSVTWTTNSNCAMLYSDALVGGSQSYLTSVIPNGDAVPLLNPANGGLNQYTFVALDQAGAVLPYNVEVIYWPRDNWPG